MKKIISLIVIIALASGCKKSVGEKQGLTNDSTSVNAVGKMASAACGNIIYIDRSQISGNWESENADVIADSTSVSGSGSGSPCSQNDIEVDLKKVEARSRDGLLEVIKFLKDNSDLICYSRSNDVINCHHLVTDPDMNEAFEAAPLVEEIALDTIRKAIGMNDAQIAAKRYTGVIVFKLNSSTASKIDIAAVNDYVAGKCCLTYPFLSSLIEMYGLKADSKFRFKMVNMMNQDTGHNEERMMFSVGTASGSKNYDYSQPPMIFNGKSSEFSPL